MNAFGAKTRSGILLLTVLCALRPSAAAVQEEVFKLRELSVFDLNERSFLRGQAGPGTDEPSNEVKQYPVFKSAKPIYGVVNFGGDYGQTGTGTAYHFAADESQGTGKGYDRLYFDLNADLDLCNDPVLRPQSRPAAGARVRDSSLRQQVIFDLISVNFDSGPAGTCAVKLMPRLTVAVYSGNDKEYKMVSFVRTDVHQGEIRIGNERYQATLGNDYVILGRLDAPGTALQLNRIGGPQDSSRWWGGDRLMAMHKVGGRYYTCSATPAGDELRVRAYDGEMGTFELGAGGRTLKPGGFQGSLQGRDRAVAVGDADANGFPMPVLASTLPAGDYRPAYLSIELGKFRIAVSHNYHSDGKPRDRGGQPPVYGIALRKDRPFVLDFREKPEVLFASPAKDQRVKLGSELEVKAVLIDPKLDIMIRRLDDTTRKQVASEEAPSQYQRNLSLDPTVIVTRTNGEKVAEGVMPFG